MRAIRLASTLTARNRIPTRASTPTDVPTEQKEGHDQRVLDALAACDLPPPIRRLPLDDGHENDHHADERDESSAQCQQNPGLRGGVTATDHRTVLLTSRLPRSITQDRSFASRCGRFRSHSRHGLANDPNASVSLEPGPLQLRKAEALPPIRGRRFRGGAQDRSAFSTGAAPSGRSGGIGVAPSRWFPLAMECRLRANKKILLVDDNEDNRTIYRVLLEYAGYRVIEAVDGEEAILRAGSSLPDLILMDLEIPKVHGLEASMAIKETPSTEDIPIFAISAHAFVEDEQLAYRAGCEKYLRKPIEPRDLLAEVEARIGPAHVNGKGRQRRRGS